MFNEMPRLTSRLGAEPVSPHFNFALPSQMYMRCCQFVCVLFPKGIKTRAHVTAAAPVSKSTAAVANRWVEMKSRIVTS